MRQGNVPALGAYIGEKYGALTVVEESAKNWVRFVRCRCECGREVTKPVGRIKADIKRGLTPSCGCLTTQKRKASGVKQFDATRYMQKRYGRLLVTGVDLDLDRKLDKYRLVCLCDCGAQRLVAARYLNNGMVRSCGCLAKEVRAANGAATIAHGHSVNGVIDGLTPIYTCWLSIRALCARGWRAGAHMVCHEYDKRWDDFHEFHRDFGDIRPSETIRRRDRQMPWSKENCYVSPGQRRKPLAQQPAAPSEE